MSCFMMPARHAPPTHGSSTDDEDEDEQFMFDDDNTIQRDVPPMCVPVLDSSVQKSELRDKSLRSATFRSSFRNASSHNESMNFIMKGNENAQGCKKLVELPWKAVFNNKKQRNVVRIPEKSHKLPSIHTPSEGVEKKRTGSGQKPTERLSSSILGSRPVNSKSNPSQKLHEDDSAKQIPPLILESNRSDYQSKPSNEQRVFTSEDDEVFYRDGDKQYHNSRPTSRHVSPGLDSLGARRFGISSYADCRPSFDRIQSDPEYYRRKREDLIVNDLCGRLKIWSRYSKALSADIARLEREESNRREIEIEERLARRMREQLFPTHKFLPSTFRNKSAFTTSSSRLGLMSQYRSQPLGNVENFEPHLRRPPAHYYYDSQMQEPEPIDSCHLVEQVKLNTKQVVKKLPYFSATLKSDQVSFSMPANRQQLLNTLKRTHPNFIPLAKRLIDKNPKCENIAEQFLDELEKRANRLAKSVERIERSLRTAMGERIEKLNKELEHTIRNLKTHIRIMQMIREELETDCQHALETQTKPTNQSHPRELNSIRILQRVFESA